MVEDLVLDTAIRDWSLIPLSLVMVLIGVLRYFLSKLMRSSQTPDLKIVKEGQVVVRAWNLRVAIWVTFFFFGFVAAKIPFPPTQEVLINVAEWYFLNLFGLRGLLTSFWERKTISAGP